MDLLDSDVCSSPDEGSGDEGNVASDRADVAVGTWVWLPFFAGRCMSDDMSWKGKKATSVAAIQTAGMGADRTQWGQFWGTALQDLGVDIGVLAGAGMGTESAITAADNGF